MTGTTHSQSTAPRTWFITGANSGIGLALAAAALKRGDNVTGSARNIAPLASLTSEYPDSFLAVTADVRDEAAVASAVDATVSKFGTVDLVVANAAFPIFAGIEEITGQQWREIFDTNFFGTTNVLRATLPILRAKKSGHVFLGSAHYGQSAHAGVGSVAATKHALEGITESLRDEVAPLGIKVTSYEPGPTATAFLGDLQMGGNTITDYDQTVRATLQALGAMPAEAFNSADAVASVLLVAADAENAPIRLATGSASYDMIKASLEKRLADLVEWESVSRSVDTFVG